MAHSIRTNINPANTSGTQLANITEDISDLTQIVVISDSTNQPTSPTEGDAYIVNGDASWAGGNQHDIAVFRDNAWVYHVPEEGWVAYVTDLGESRRFNGTDWSTKIATQADVDANSTYPLDPENATDGGTDAYVSETTTSTPASGSVIIRDFQSANTTTTPTLDGVTITTKDGSALWAGAIDGVHAFQWDGGNSRWLVVDPIPQTDIGTDAIAQLDKFTRGHIDGLELANNSTDSAHDIDIATGVCSMRDGSGNRKLFELTSSLTKQIDANWSEGTDAGGFPSGLTLSADTHYNVFLIGKDDGTVDAGFDTDSSASNLLSDASSYSWFRRIGSVFTDGSSNIRAFTQNGDWFSFSSDIDDISDPSVSLQTPVNAAITVPPNQVARVTAQVFGSNVGAIRAWYVQTIDVIDFSDFPSASVGIDASSNGSGNNRAISQLFVEVDDSSQIQYAGDAEGSGSESVDNLAMSTWGWIDDRGRNAG